MLVFIKQNLIYIQNRFLKGELLLEETHRKIAQKIAKELNLREREASLLETGSVNPDSWANFPHHHGKEAEIVRHILDARRLFLHGDDECYFRLGIALHYIQDRWTLRPRLKDKHTKWEVKIERAPILDDSQLAEFIKNALFPTKVEEAYLKFLEEIRERIENVTPMTDASIQVISVPKEYRDRYPFTDPTFVDTLLERALDLLQTKIRRESALYSQITHDETKEPTEFCKKWKPLRARYFRGLGLKTISFALLERPADWSTPVLDINLAYRICLEVARKTLSREHDKSEWYDQEAEKHDAEIAARELARKKEEREKKENIFNES